ncbi:hypothetical protein [Streptococcus sp. S784/96/1]|uniref:hypothetical protein n=1 Tax=Streptococcus sp. S784/96/1 TaxID=2653499 RepID=UPI001EE4C853|nr:hypothetical protein [Streptococcus sp. S784/96/1]
MILMVECRHCGQTHALRGWIEPIDLKGTIWEGFDENQIKEAEKENIQIFEGLDPVDRFEASGNKCLSCGSENTLWY